MEIPTNPENNKNALATATYKVAAPAPMKTHRTTTERESYQHQKNHIKLQKINTAHQLKKNKHQDYPYI